MVFPELPLTHSKNTWYVMVQHCTGGKMSHLDRVMDLHGSIISVDFVYDMSDVVDPARAGAASGRGGRKTSAFSEVQVMGPLEAGLAGGFQHLRRVYEPCRP